MRQRDIEDVIIRLLAEDAGRDPEDLRAELAELGEDLPIDSVLGAEVLVRLEQQYGISLPATAETSQSLTSVTAYARAILARVADSRGTALGAGA